MTQRPGVMLYFDVAPCLERLSLEEKGRLFAAILEYGQYGVVPDLEGMTGVAWDFIRPRVDRDAERYEEKCQRMRSNAKKRWEKEEEMQTDAIACKSMPNTNTKTETTSSSSSASASKGALRECGPVENFNALKNAALSRLDGLGL